MTYTSSFLMVCSGYYEYAQGYTPRCEGQDDYRGRLLHAQHWPEDLDYKDKNVVVIGSGASAAQIIPELAKVATRVDMYQRTPNWITPQGNREVSSLRKTIYQYVPLALKLERLRSYTYSELGFRAIFPLQLSMRKDLEEGLKGYIHATIEDEALIEKLIPDYEFGCKRPLVTDHFYPSLNRDNVNVITEGIARLTSQGIMSHAGTERGYDIIVMATGYDLAAVPFPVSGRNGRSLQAAWQEKPEAYEGMVVHGFPNLHLMGGPNSGFFGSYIIQLETAANYHIQLIRQARGAHLVEPLLEAQQDYSRALQADLQKTVWAGSCKSWYKLDNGHVVANHPHPISRGVYDRARPRWEHFSISER